MSNKVENKEQIINSLKRRVREQILEPTNCDLLIKLIDKAETLNEALAIAELGTSYKRTGFHFDKRLEKQIKGTDIRYLKKNDTLSFQKGERVHKLIIGDNYEALQQLLISYRHGIDVIYIDPPYGKDSMGEFAETNYDNAITRDNLLSMLYPRLLLAKELLVDDGVIMCSIDDKNQAYVKCLFDEVFGEKSCAAVITVESATISGPRRVPAMQGTVVKTAEYCLIYVNGDNKKVMRNLKYDYIRGFDVHYSKFYSSEKNEILDFLKVIKDTPEIVKEFEKHELKVSLKNLGVLIAVSDITKEWLYSDDIATNLFRKGDKVSAKVASTITIEKNTIEKIDKKNIVNIDGTCYEAFIYQDRIGWCDDYFKSYGERQVRGNLWKGFSSDGGNLAKEGGVSFLGGKKPLRLIKQLISAVEFNNNGIILDFFAGSGTTGEAVYTLNQEDNGNRKFILCTNNEKTSDCKNGIAIDATHKRMQNTILEDSLDVYGIGTVSNFDNTVGATPFDVIDETCYGLPKFENINDKIRWVCLNFENTQISIEENN